MMVDMIYVMVHGDKSGRSVCMIHGGENCNGI